MAKWSAVLGSGILTVYFIPAAYITLWDYAKGEVTSSPAQLGMRMALVVPILLSFTIAIREVRFPPASKRRGMKI